MSDNLRTVSRHKWDEPVTGVTGFDITDVPTRRVFAPLFDDVGLREPVLRVLRKPRGEPIVARDRLGDEVERLLQALVRLGAAEAQEAGAGLAEALAAEAGDAEVSSAPSSRYSARPWLVMPSSLQTRATFGKT